MMVATKAAMKVLKSVEYSAVRLELLTADLSGKQMVDLSVGNSVQLSAA